MTGIQGEKEEEDMDRGLTSIVVLTSALALLVPASAATAMDPVVLPDDESVHWDIPVEWWYFTGHLYGRDLFGRSHEYGFELNMARTDVLGLAPVASIYMGHLGISDINRGTHKMCELNLGLLPDIVPSWGGFDIEVGDTHIRGKSGNYNLRGKFADFSYSGIDLNLSQSEPLALHGGDGIMPYAMFGETGYYSATKLDVTGFLFDHGMPVWINEGIAWHDRQWGDWEGGVGGWEWFSIQLDNDTEYMLYFIHDEDWRMVQESGTLVHPDGSTTELLDPDSIGYTVHDYWTSPDTGNTYQIGWTVQVPGGTLTVTPQIVDQEMWNPFFSVMNYWEGTCTVSGTINGLPVTGVAFQEQTLMLPMWGSGSIW
jgi:predicted secreted hydrolase